MSLLTVNEVQTQLNVSRACVYSLVESGQLPCIRIGIGRGTIRIDATDLEAFIESRKYPPRKQARARPANGKAFIHLDANRLRQAWSKDE